MYESVVAAGPGACILCGSSGGAIVLREPPFVGRECDCGVVYIDPMPSNVDPTHDLHVGDYYQMPARMRLDWIRKFRGPCRLLEVGAGAGHLLAMARTAGYDVAAIEPDAACARHLRELGIPVEPSLVEDSTLPAGAYDVVFHVDLLSHFPDPVRALEAMARLAAPDATVCFEVGVFGGLNHAWYPWIGRPGFPEHLWFYSEPAIRTVLARAGLEPVGIRRFGLFPSTIVSSLGKRLFGTVASESAQRGGDAGHTSGWVHAYERFQYLIRYPIGAWVPGWGPRALFVAARHAR